MLEQGGQQLVQKDVTHLILTADIEYEIFFGMFRFIVEIFCKKINHAFLEFFKESFYDVSR